MSLVEPKEPEPLDPSTINFNDYWAIDPQGLAWEFVLKRLCKGVPETALDFLVGVTPDGRLRWFLNKRAFSVEVLAKALGATVPSLKDAKVITLAALERKDPPNQPRPTVNYYGEA